MEENKSPSNETLLKYLVDQDLQQQNLKLIDRIYHMERHPLNWIVFHYRQKIFGLISSFRGLIHGKK